MTASFVFDIDRDHKLKVGLFRANPVGTRAFGNVYSLTVFVDDRQISEIFGYFFIAHKLFDPFVHTAVENDLSHSSAVRRELR